MIVIDLETSGPYADTNGIISIGALEFENPENAFYEECRLEHGKQVDPISIEVTGFTEGQMRDHKKKTIKAVLLDFIDWLGTVHEKTFAAHNTPFDWKFMEWEFRQNKLEWPFHFRSVDIHGLVYGHMRQRGLQPPLRNDVSAIGMKKILEYCGLEDPREIHNALEDAKLEAECFHRILYGKPMFSEYSDQKIPEYLRR